MHDPMGLAGEVVMAIAVLYLIVGIARFNNAMPERGLRRNRRKDGSTWPR